MARAPNLRLLLATALAALSLVVTSSPAVAADPVLTTQASASGFPVGVAIFDTATLGLGLNPTGTLTFNLFGPDNPACAGPPIFTSTVPVSGNGFYQSASVPTVSAGTYQWVASYSGDANNTPVTTACGDPTESTVVARRTPQLNTQASLVAPGTVSDTATLTGGAGPAGPTGTITFTLFGPNNPVCAGAPIFTSVKTVAGNGAYVSDPFTTPAPGVYQWLARYSGDANNNQVGTICTDPLESVTVPPGGGVTTPTLTTTASPGVPVGGQISDTAALSGGSAPTGTITFNLFGPNNPTCTGPPAFTSAKPVAGNGTYISDPFAPILPGTYRWVATYSGDANNTAVATACNDPAEAVVVTSPATATLVTTASASVALGGQVSDAATLSGATNPTGSITFTLFGPDNATCTGPPVVTSVKPVAGNGTYVSDPFTPTAPGTYRWVATYSGDANNPLLATACGDPAETVVVTPPGAVSLTTTASPSVTLGGQVTDTATLSGGTNPTGTITFRLFGPNNATCGGVPTFTSVKPVAGSGTYTSDPFTPTAAGTYRWVAAYSGDANHAPVATACGDPAETVVITSPAPSLVTTASPSVPVGGQLTDSATLSGGTNPTGTITFNLFGPNDAACGGPPPFTSVKPVPGNGTVTSDPFTPIAAGTYRWVATYSGDANHPPLATACGDPAETVVVAPVVIPPGAVSLVTAASPSVPVGGQISDAATISGGVNLTGTITFSLFGPDNAACTGTPVFTSVKPVAGAGTVTSDPFVPNAPGTYRWIATYSGDSNNAGVATACNDPAEAVTVTPRPPGTITVAKTASPSTLPEPGGTFTFSVAVTNTGGQAVAIVGLVDDIYGSLPARAGSSCTNALGTVLAPGTSYTCSFTGTFTGNAGAVQADTVTASALDASGTPLVATARATVAITNVIPQILVDKTVSPGTRPEPGGSFTFGVTVTNVSAEPLRVTSLVDDVVGNLNGRGTCAVGAVLAPAGAYACSFSAEFTGNAGATRTNTVTAAAVDDDGTSATASDSATVRLTDVAPSITVAHVVDPPTRPEEGGSFTHTVIVTNTSGEPVRIISLVDSIFGDLAVRPGSTCTSTPGTILAPGGTYTCTFTATFTGEAGATQTDIVAALVVDDEGTPATGTGAATVTLTDVPPRVDVDLAVTPQSRPEPGGTFTYTVTVRNLSNPETVRTTSLVSSVHGNLDGRGTCRIGVVLPPPPAPGSTYTCSFTDAFTGNAGARQVTRISVTVVDNEGTPATALSDELEGTVVITNVLPSLAVTKTASPASLPAPGGQFTFTVTVTNTGNEPFTVLSLLDDVHGDLHGQGSCSRGATVTPAAPYTCAFRGSFTGSAGATQTDVVTATVVDDEGSQAAAQARATVSLTAAPTVPGMPPDAVPTAAVPVVAKPSPLAFTGTSTWGPVRVATLLTLLGVLLMGTTSRRPAPLKERVGTPSTGANIPLFGGGNVSGPPENGRLAVLRGMGLGGRWR